MSSSRSRPAQKDGQDSFLQRAGDHRLLTHAEEIELAERIQARGPDWREARNELVMHNVRLAVKVAQKFQYRGVEFDDLVQMILFGQPSSGDATISGGIARAAELYDGRFRFSTYAMQWAIQAAQRAEMNHTELIRLPNNTKKIRWTAENNPELTDDEIAVKHEVSRNTVRSARKAARVIASLDAPKRVDGGEGSSEYDLIRDAEADDPAELVEDGGLGASVRELLEGLPEDERRVIEMTFGLNGYRGREHTLDEICELTGLPHNRVHEAKLNAMRLLRERTTA